jgi:putative membrane protein
MKKLKLIFAAVAMTASFAFMQSCKSDDNKDFQMDNQTFVNQASSSNNFEIAAGTLTTTHSQNALVQQYGQHMVMEHTAVGTDMASLAKSKNLNVPTTFQAKEQTNINALSALSGAEFDAQFVNMMIVSHQDAITLFQNASGNKGVSDGDLRNFAASKLPSLQEHLKDAQTLKTQVTGAQ